jgi:lysozyme
VSTVYSRWAAKLAARKALLVAARKRHEAHPTDASRALLVKRKLQVVEAEKVVARHRPARRPTGVSEHGAELIARFEGGQSRDGLFHPYRDVVGVWTIGYGHTAGVSAASKPLTKAQALALLRDDLDHRYAPPVLALVKAGVPLTQNMVDALVSLVYNCGPGAIAPSGTIGRALRAHRFQDAANGFLLWCRAGGQILPGLRSRRIIERALFLAPAH